MTKGQSVHPLGSKDVCTEFPEIFFTLDKRDGNINQLAFAFQHKNL